MPKVVRTFLTSKRFFPSEASPDADLDVFTTLSFAALASCISTSAMLLMWFYESIKIGNRVVALIRPRGEYCVVSGGV